MKKPIRLHYRNIYILPSKSGLGFALLILLLITIAAIYNNNLVYLLSFLLGSIFFITILHTVKSLVGLEIRLGKSPEIFLGDTTQTRLWLNNTSADERFSVYINEQSIDIAAQDKASITLQHKPKKRGWYQSPYPVISSYYPFGLFRAWIKLKIEINTLVYPQPSKDNLPFPKTMLANDKQGFALQRGQDDFYGLQEYQAGDSIRHIHWRALAKGQGLQIKQFSSETQAEDLYLDYELTTGGDVEQRLSQMCRWVLDAHKADINYGFKLGELNLKPQSGEAHYKQCLEALARF